MAAQSLSVLPVSPSSSGCRCRNPHNSPFFNPNFITSGAAVCSLTGLHLSNQPSSKTSRRYSSIFATVSSSPTAPTPEKAASEKSAKWSFRFIKSFAMGELEARKLKYNNTGTESLLMGILVEGTSLAAKLLRESGVTLFKVREETVKLLGKSDMYIFSPEHPPLTEAAQKAIDWAINEKLKSGTLSDPCIGTIIYLFIFLFIEF
ncbi:hypothetical protein R6Q57_005274 [Mikania cordata]